MALSLPESKQNDAVEHIRPARRLTGHQMMDHKADKQTVFDSQLMSKNNETNESKKSAHNQNETPQPNPTNQAIAPLRPLEP